MFRGPYADRIERMARRGHRGFPTATIAFYGPDDTRASKLVFSVVPADSEAELVAQQKWFSETSDLRYDRKLAQQVLALIETHKCLTVVMPGSILGCPHETGKDYAQGEDCPHCPFWAGKDRFAGQASTTIHSQRLPHGPSESVRRE
jgi:hypothetical protein